MTYRTAMLALVCVGVSGLAVAQTPPSQNPTPRAPNEAPTTDTSSSRPSDASSPHQRQAMGKEHEQMMKDCIAKERAQNSSLSKEAAQKTCKEQMKSMSKDQ